MQVTAIIAEFNPLHKGHAHLLSEARLLTKADYLVIIMSGNFVQRGEPAVIDKYVRTQMALECGADLVLELPTPYATGSAEYFAKGSIKLINELGVVNALCFGSECGDSLLLRKAAAMVCHESSAYTELLRTHLQQGLSYPAARMETLRSLYPNDTEILSVLNGPNNILALEYLKALMRSGSDITPYTIPRLGADYHDASPESDFCSATALRQAMYHNGSMEIFKKQMPVPCAELLKHTLEETGFLALSDFNLPLHYKLLSEKGNGFTDYLDVSSDLSDRIVNNLNNFKNCESFISLLKSKDMTYTRISRSLLHILLNITKEEISLYDSLAHMPYLRMLGFRKDSSELLKAIKEKSPVPLLSKPADAQKILTSDSFNLLEKEMTRSSYYESVLSLKSGNAFRNEYTRPMIVK